jgi:hypothetical protein
VLVVRLGAEHAELPGSAHNAQQAPGFNDLLAGFLGTGDSRQT